MPRPRLLNPTKRAAVVAQVASGLTLDEAARYVGCSPKTIRRESDRDASFRNELGDAELAAQSEPLRIMRQAASTHWRAAAWLLERTDPERFARRPAGAARRPEVEHAMARLIETALATIYDPELRRTLYQRLKEDSEQSLAQLFP